MPAAVNCAAAGGKEEEKAIGAAMQASQVKGDKFFRVGLRNLVRIPRFCGAKEAPWKCLRRCPAPAGLRIESRFWGAKQLG
jgi:hypothetical protein